jgi:hypothetical protein
VPTLSAADSIYGSPGESGISFQIMQTKIQGWQHFWSQSILPAEETGWVIKPKITS